MVKKSKRHTYADKVYRMVPYHLDRSTKDLSNNQLKKIGKARGIV